jgi:hypothetical protein
VPKTSVQGGTTNKSSNNKKVNKEFADISRYQKKESKKSMTAKKN